MDTKNIPNHIAIVMDGNGRWASKRGISRNAGHKEGSKTFEKIARYCRDIGVEYLTVYAFSTENWKRPESEVKNIMNLLKKYLDEIIKNISKENIKLRVIGSREGLSKDILDRIDKIEKHQQNMKPECTVNIALNYGSRDEIKNAVKKIARDVLDQKIKIDNINEQLISYNLYTEDTPDPDLVIRPSGEMRLSNFLLWQSAYSEYYFTEVLWPDFNEDEIDKAVMAFNKRDRRFGGI